MQRCLNWYANGSKRSEGPPLAMPPNAPDGSRMFSAREPLPGPLPHEQNPCCWTPLAFWGEARPPDWAAPVFSPPQANVQGCSEHWLTGSWPFRLVYSEQMGHSCPRVSQLVLPAWCCTFPGAASVAIGWFRGKGSLVGILRSPADRLSDFQCFPPSWSLRDSPSGQYKDGAPEIAPIRPCLSISQLLLCLRPPSFCPLGPAPTSAPAPFCFRPCSSSSPPSATSVPGCLPPARPSPCWCRSCVVAKLCLTLLWCRGPARLLSQWDFLGKNTGVGCRFLLHGDLLSSVIKPSSALAGGFFITEPPDSRSVISFLAPH